MIITKILGTGDIIIALLIFLAVEYHLIPKSIIFAIGIYLVVKSLIFIWGRDIASMVEIILGILIITSIYIAFPFWSYRIIIAYFAIKGVFSWIG